jgi:restriction system protein
MAVPDFQTWFLPLLKRLADGEIHRLRDLYLELADDLELSDEERKEVLPSGKQIVVGDNPVGHMLTGARPSICLSRCRMGRR